MHCAAARVAAVRMASAKKVDECFTSECYSALRRWCDLPRRRPRELRVQPVAGPKMIKT
jgi:hypothetical protein